MNWIPDDLRYMLARSIRAYTLGGIYNPAAA